MTIHRNPRQDRSEDVAADVGRRRRLGSLGRARRRAWAPGRADQRGSALILVIVCLVMMVLMGTAYIQIARVDRRATVQLTAIDVTATVKDAVIAYIGQVLGEDLIKSDTNGFFAAADYLEPYDYPFTNSAVGYNVYSGNPNTVGTLLGQAKGGQFDDTWLASTVLDERSGVDHNGKWTHISNLNGVFLRLPKTGSGQAFPQEVLTSNDEDGLGNWNNNLFATTSGLSQTDATYEEPGVDSDGDGIRDARWTWAPESVRQVGSSAFVVAYRIIDLSSLADVNVLTSTNSDGRGNTGWTAPHEANYGVFPSDGDLTRLFALAGARANWHTSELDDVLAVRFGSAVTPVQRPAGLMETGSSFPFQLAATSPARSRAQAWLDPSIGIRHYGYTNNKFGFDDEKELRARGGLNTATTTPLELAAPLATRKNALTEVDYRSAIAGAYNWDGSAPFIYFWATHGFMHGGEYFMSEPGGYPMTTADRHYRAVRHLLTTMSGASVLAPRYSTTASPATAGAAGRLQVDLVWRNQGSPDARIKEIRDRMYEVLKVGSPSYLGMGDAALQATAAQFAVNIVDYIDTDESVNVWTDPNGNKYYGMEALPFIREVYLQAAYEDKDLLDAMGAVGTADGMFDTFELKPESQAIAIEIANPFDKKITLGGRVRLAIWQDGAEVEALPLAGTMDARDPSAPIKNVHIYYSNPKSPGMPAEADSGGAGSYGTDLKADLGLNSYTIALKSIGEGGNIIGTAGWAATLQPKKDTFVILQVRDESTLGNPWVTYDVLRMPGLQFPNPTHATGDAITHAPNAVQDKARHYQRTMRRDGEKTRFMSNIGKALGPERLPGSAGFARPTDTPPICYLGLPNKGVTGDLRMDKMQVAIANRQIYNVAELGYIFMAGFTKGDPHEGKDFASRISGPKGDANDSTAANASILSISDTPLSLQEKDRLYRSERWFLTMKDLANTFYVPGETGVPHMAMVFDQFTTLSPRWDSLDNDNLDGDNTLTTGADNEEEQFVPGRMNINTAPWWLAAMTTSLPEQLLWDNDASDIETYFREIMRYRDNPSQRSTYTGISGLRSSDQSDRGIRGIGELLLVHANTGDKATSKATMRYGEDTTALAATDMKRHYPHPDERDKRPYTYTSSVSDVKIYDDEYVAQERMARFQYLNSTLTTRSDRYCAYVVIREYGASSFNTAPISSMKFFVMLDRSRIVDTQSQVVISPKTGVTN